MSQRDLVFPPSWLVPRALQRWSDTYVHTGRHISALLIVGLILSGCIAHESVQVPEFEVLGQITPPPTKSDGPVNATIIDGEFYGASDAFFAAYLDRKLQWETRERWRRVALAPDGSFHVRYPKQNRHIGFPYFALIPFLPSPSRDEMRSRVLFMRFDESRYVYRLTMQGGAVELETINVARLHEKISKSLKESIEYREDEKVWKRFDEKRWKKVTKRSELKSKFYASLQWQPYTSFQLLDISRSKKLDYLNIKILFKSELRLKK